MAIASHFWNMGHEINNSAILLKSVNELINNLGQHTHHIMNFEVPPDSFLIKKYECRSPDSTSIASTSIATMYDTTLQLI